MRRDKTLKVCANHISKYNLNPLRRLRELTRLSTVSADMRLQPNIGSDRSWVWKVAADYAESPATPETLAIRFANAESKCSTMRKAMSSSQDTDAGEFKKAFEEAQVSNAAIASGGAKEESETKAEEKTEEEEKKPEAEAETEESKDTKEEAKEEKTE